MSIFASQSGSHTLSLAHILCYLRITLSFTMLRKGSIKWQIRAPKPVERQKQRYPYLRNTGYF